MASADYRHCDCCGEKAFYDATLNYDCGPESPNEEKIRGEEYKLDRLGDWAVLCRECAKSYRCVIVARTEG